jgi:hypothetical protein
VCSSDLSLTVLQGGTPQGRHRSSKEGVMGMTGNGAEPAVLSRRDAIIGALALAAGTLLATKPDTALAADGDAMHLGTMMSGTGATYLLRSPSGLWGGGSNSLAILNGSDGTRDYAVWGNTGTVAGAGSTGVWGRGTAAGFFGVFAENYAVGGIGLKASAPLGVALQVDGPAAFSRSGKGAIQKGHASATVNVPSGVSTGALILVTLQGSAGTGRYVRYARRVSATSFRVYLSKSAAAKVYFAWFILN